MLKIVIPDTEFWNEKTEEFVYRKGAKISLEHSLVSVSKWESKWNKSFLSSTEKTFEETVDYIRCMTLTQNINPEVYLNLTEENIKAINEYIDSPMSATYFYDDGRASKNREQITSELIYYWMIALNIPFECQKWHLSRLLTLIRVCSIKNQPKNKHTRNEILSRNAALNAQRKRELNTKG